MSSRHGGRGRATVVPPATALRDLRTSERAALRHGRRVPPLRAATLRPGPTDSLRRRRRRLDARKELQVAHDLFSDFGMEAFAERARVELQATGERARTLRGYARPTD